jgi:hypothetical protein
MYRRCCGKCAPARLTAWASPFSARNFNSQSRCTSASFIKVAHDLNSEFVADRQNGHMQILRPSFHETATQTHHPSPALASPEPVSQAHKVTNQVPSGQGY